MPNQAQQHGCRALGQHLRPVDRIKAGSKNARGEDGLPGSIPDLLTYDDQGLQSASAAICLYVVTPVYSKGKFLWMTIALKRQGLKFCLHSASVALSTPDPS